MTISDGTRNWYGLGPVSMLPEYQRQGIGKALIQEGLSRLKDMNAQGCCLVGHPDYYGRFRFSIMSGLVHEGVPQEAFFALSFGRATARAQPGYSAAKHSLLRGSGDHRSVHNADPGHHGERVLSFESHLIVRTHRNCYSASGSLGQTRLHQPNNRHNLLGIAQQFRGGDFNPL